MIQLEIPDSVGTLLERLWSHGHAAYVVGGSVRDALLGRTSADWDLATDARPDRILALFPGGSYDITSFNFEYQSSDGTLYYRHWQDKSAKDSGEKFEGDIATS